MVAGTACTPGLRAVHDRSHSLRSVAILKFDVTLSRGMELSRRDLMAALAAVGVSNTAGCFEQPPVLGDHERETLVALAEVLYPSEVTGIPEFVEQYSIGRVTDRPEYKRGMADAISTLDDYATDWFKAEFRDLELEDRDALLDQMGVDAADPDGDGSPPERIRFYLVNDLLYALYTTPTGGELVGSENPQGYPGGTTSYQRGPSG